MVVITSGHREAILSAVRDMYSQVALQPETTFHFPTGRRACEFVGYPAELLDRVPTGALESFAGVGYVFAADVIRAGDRVLDIGSGSGTDTLIAAQHVGPRGKVYGLDLTSAMRQKLQAILAANSITNVEVVAGNAERIPLPDDAVSAVTTNGVLNLVPNKRAAISEIARILEPGGRVQVADIVLGQPASAECASQPQLWAECIVGATTEGDYLDLFRAAGFEDVEVLHSFDYFAGSENASTRSIAGRLGAHAIVMRARKAAD
jgi:SAM-dependent methyltransferase